MTIEQLERLGPHGLYDVRDQLKRHIYRRSEEAFAAGDAARDAITSPTKLAARQEEIRKRFLASLGGLPPGDTPLNAQSLGIVEGAGFRVEKIVYESRPRNYVTANLYLPNDLGDPRGAVLFLCGHHQQAKHNPEYQTVCQYLVQAGLIVLAQDPIGQGERLSYYETSLQDAVVAWGTREHDYAGAQCLAIGDTLARYFLHDSMRSVDYLRSRPEVDGLRIGVTGNSGGGTQTCLMMLADERIAAAAPATFIMSRQSYLLTGGPQDAEQIWPGFTASGFDHEDILIAMAPRPIRVLAVTSDFFPIEGTRRTVARCKRFWKLCGVPDGLDLVEDDSSHAYTVPLARAAARFFARTLLGTDPALDNARIAPFAPERLWCTTSGQVRGELANAAAVPEANRERAHALGEKRHALPRSHRRDLALAWLTEKVFRDRQRCDLNPRFYFSGRMEEIAVQSALWRSQEDLFAHGFILRDYRLADRSLPVTMAVWDGGTDSLSPHWEWLRQECAEERAVLVLDVSGVGPLAPHSYLGNGLHELYGVIHKLATDLLWLDDDLVSLRTFDVLRALDMVARWPGLDASDIRCYACGRQGVYGRLAGLIDPRIQNVEVVQAFEYGAWAESRYYDLNGIYSVILNGILQHFDLPELEPNERGP